MKKTALALMLLSSYSYAEQPVSASLTISNTQETTQETWVSGEKVTLSTVSGTLIPCQPGEEMEVQLGEKIVYAKCGEELETVK